MCIPRLGGGSNSSQSPIVAQGSEKVIKLKAALPAAFLESHMEITISR